MKTKFLRLVERVIHNRSFMFLWAAQVFSQLANNALNFALGLKIFTLTQSTTSFSFLFAAVGIPAILFGSVAGVFSDWIDKKLILVISTISRAGLVLLLLFYQNQFWAILAIIFLISTMMQLFAPAEASLIAVLVGKHSLMTANSLFSLTFNASVLGGWALASVLIAGFRDTGYSIIIIGSAICFALATACSLFIFQPKTEKIEASKKTTSHVFKDLIQGWKKVIREKNLRQRLSDLTVISASTTFIMVLAPALAKFILQQEAEEATHLVLIPATIGIIVGLVALRVLRPHFAKGKLIKFGILATGAGIMLIPLLTLVQYRPFFLFFLVIIISLFNPFVSVPAISLLQEETEPEYRGRVFGVMNMLLNATAAFPVIIIGVLADTIGLPALLIGGGLIFFLYGIACN